MPQRRLLLLLLLLVVIFGALQVFIVLMSISLGLALMAFFMMFRLLFVIP